MGQKTEVNWEAIGWIGFGGLLATTLFLSLLVFLIIRAVWRLNGLGAYAVAALSDAGKRAIASRLGAPVGLEIVPEPEPFPLQQQLRPPRVPSNAGQTPYPREEEPLS